MDVSLRVSVCDLFFFTCAEREAVMSLSVGIKFVIICRRRKRDLNAHYNAILSVNQPLVGFIQA